MISRFKNYLTSFDVKIQCKLLPIHKTVQNQNEQLFHRYNCDATFLFWILLQPWQYYLTGTIHIVLINKIGKTSTYLFLYIYILTSSPPRVIKAKRIGTFPEYLITVIHNSIFDGNTYAWSLLYFSEKKYQNIELGLCRTVKLKELEYARRILLSFQLKTSAHAM